MIFITDKELELLHMPGFISRYLFYYGEGFDCAESYERTEEDLERVFKYRRYKNYMSFRRSMDNYFKRMKQEHKKNVGN